MVEISITPSISSGVCSVLRSYSLLPGYQIPRLVLQEKNRASAMAGGGGGTFSGEPFFCMFNKNGEIPVIYIYIFIYV